jgi:hypothetical protein
MIGAARSDDDDLQTDAELKAAPEVVARQNQLLPACLSPLASPKLPLLPAKANSGRLSSSANQCVTFGRLSVHSQKDVAGTKQRHSDFSHPRQ